MAFTHPSIFEKCVNVLVSSLMNSWWFKNNAPKSSFLAKKEARSFLHHVCLLYKNVTVQHYQFPPRAGIRCGQKKHFGIGVLIRTSLRASVMGVEQKLFKWPATMFAQICSKKAPLRGNSKISKWPTILILSIEICSTLKLEQIWPDLLHFQSGAKNLKSYW
jgi:hypothetical protein